MYLTLHFAFAANAKDKHLDSRIRSKGKVNWNSYTKIEIGVVFVNDGVFNALFSTYAFKLLYFIILNMANRFLGLFVFLFVNYGRRVLKKFFFVKFYFDSDAIINENTETTSVQLKASQNVNKNEEATEDGNNQEDGRREAGINTKISSNNENISFDFFINISIGIANEDKIKLAISKSVDVDVNQIQDFKVTNAGNEHRELVRITVENIGHKFKSTTKKKKKLFRKHMRIVATNDWEIRTLADKFTRLVPDRVLSGNLKEALGLEEQPRVSRFYSRSSTAHLPSITNISPFPLDKTNSTQPTPSNPNNPNPNSTSANSILFILYYFASFYFFRLKEEKYMTNQIQNKVILTMHLVLAVDVVPFYKMILKLQFLKNEQKKI
ncbi:hypothetical protein RFI_11523 [Reticulomyxa filosa]|uniref:Uncharacterized protein n=1 Tax=Reticulomyxa filosa TaxID=46433 RepID=X6NH20_RETFI|nr:hypothetical protein RFI_11523 [Reticulomyxa filosa]|eukprot:ETO25615.1 hypothetical protein RFI_11523 [Reticulomyxa filosa]